MDDLNRVALGKRRFYVSERVDDMVTQGEDITARVHYQRLERLFLQTGAESLVLLGRRLAACKYAEGRRYLSGLQSWNLCTVSSGRGRKF